MRKFIGILLLLAAAGSFTAAAQSKTIIINGRVTSFEESLPLEGVSIVVKGDPAGTGTQADGSFSLPVAPGGKKLLISLAGYEKQEIELTKATEYNIVLKRGNGAGFISTVAITLRQRK
jgi:hypothetical protein